MNLLASAGKLLGLNSHAGPTPTKRGGENVEYWWNRIGAGDPMGQTLNQPYRYSTWIRRAIQIKAGEITGAPLKFYQGEKEYEEENFLKFWKEPAIGPEGTRLSLGETYEALCGWLDLKGIYYIILDDSWVLPFVQGTPSAWAPFIVARPDRMRRVMNGKVLIGYSFTDGAGISHALLPEQVIISKYWNPYDLWDGLAPLDSVMIAAEGDYLAGQYVRNLMKNNGDTGPYIIDKDGMPDDKVKDSIKAALIEKRMAAQNGAFKPIFLGGNIKVESPESQAPDLAMQSSRVQNRHEVAIGLGIPPSMFDVIANYSIGSASARFELITTTCVPLGKKVTHPFGFIASKQTGLTLTPDVDWRDHEVMVEVRRERLKTIDGLWAKGMPMMEINEFLDLGMKKFPGWETGYLPFSVVPVLPDGTMEQDTRVDPQAAPKKDDPKQDDASLAKAFGDLRTLLALPSSQRNGHVEIVEDDDVPTFVRARSPKEIANWKNQMAKRRTSEKRTLAGIQRSLMGARAEVLQKIEHQYPDSKAALLAVTKSGMASNLNFSVHDFKVDLMATLKKSAKLNVDDAGEQLLSEVGVDDAFDMADEKVLQFFRKRENLLADVPDEIHKTIERQLEEGISAGESQGELSNRIREAFNVTSRGRASVIAQTETGAAYGYGRDEGMRQAGVSWKQWLSAADDRVRDDHAIANGQVVMIDEAFEVGGESLDYPCASGGSPENVINCRCVSIPLLEAPEGESAKRPVARRISK